MRTRKSRERGNAQKLALSLAGTCLAEKEPIWLSLGLSLGSKLVPQLSLLAKFRVKGTILITLVL